MEIEPSGKTPIIRTIRAAISGPGPLVGPVLAAQFGYLPSALWILIGVVLGGAVQDFVILFCSMRRNGKSLAQMVKEELHSTAGVIGIVAILAIMIILLPSHHKVNLLGDDRESLAPTREQLYVETLEKRFNGINRCC